MADDTPSHRYWLKRYRRKVVMMKSSKCRLYDAATGEMFGQEFIYPTEFDNALKQLNIFRQREQEPIDNIIFADNYEIDGQ